ncbi:hypothetical protein [Flavobacterium psychrophilum]|uniref:hypothetical protein n=1 Tax=Flavobacterium psychrophilum TaxID=96345 RepID=UPI000B7C1ED8|nr:hypothetical protein [Flavobacterium psychrophilum]SNA75209.1 hypothetical protein DK095_420004 [Flavobacterium psychrophilum]
MEIVSILNEQIKNRFIANSAIQAINEKVKSITKELVLKKYKEKKFIKNGLEFELIEVLVDFNNWRSDSLSISKIQIELAYFCTSKLPKHKRERLEKAKEYLLKHKRLDWNTYDVPIWIRLNYILELKDVLEGNVNLRIE